METIINLNPRKGIHHTLKQLKRINHFEKGESKTYKLVTDFPISDTGSFGHNRYIRPYYGPLLMETMIVRGTDLIVDQIVWNETIGYIITFK